MFRIGIIGTENSHAMAFAKAINLVNPKTKKYDFEDARIVGVYGPDKESTNAIMDEVGVDFIAEDVSEFMGKVDAMMITSRKGSVHYEYAVPFIEKGIPVFIDKPITSEGKQAKQLIELAKKHNTPMLGGSGCKYAYDVQTLKNIANTMKDEGSILSGAMSFSLQKDSEYDGFYFYASHLIEMVLTVFGYDMQSVQAFERDKTVVAVARYEKFDVTMHFCNESKSHSGIIFGTTKNHYRELDITGIYTLEVTSFLNMLRSNKMKQSYEDIIKPVYIMDAILKSLETGSCEKI